MERGADKPPVRRDRGGAARADKGEKSSFRSDSGMGKRMVANRESGYRLGILCATLHGDGRLPDLRQR